MRRGNGRERRYRRVAEVTVADDAGDVQVHVAPLGNTRRIRLYVIRVRLTRKKTKKGEEPLDTGGGRVFFSLDASSGLLATRRRLGHRGDSSALRSAFVV